MLGNKNSDVPLEFSQFAEEFFGMPPRPLLYYGPDYNYLELVYRIHDVHNGQPRQVDLKICFEPGWPTEPFDEEAWFAAHNDGPEEPQF